MDQGYLSFLPKFGRKAKSYILPQHGSRDTSEKFQIQKPGFAT